MKIFVTDINQGRPIISREPVTDKAKVGSSSELVDFIEKAEIIIEYHNNQTRRQLEGNNDEDNPLEEIQFNTRCLMQLVPALQRNIARSKRSDARQLLSPPETFRVSGPARTYVSLAREKFQKADLNLVERLGESNWQRHVRIRDRIYRSNDCVEEKEAPANILSVARSLFRPPPTFHDSGLGTTISANSQRAASVASHTSFASSMENGSTTSLRVPSMPLEVTDGKSFTCFICGALQSKINNRIDWK